MSKSKGNIVNPNEIINQGYGADSIRLAIAFLAPFDQTTPWSPDSIPGTYRFLNRLWTLVQESIEASNETSADDSEIQRITHKAIKKVTADIEHMNFNTALAALMEAVNELFKVKSKQGYGSASWRPALEQLVQLTAPFAPHITEEMWQDLDGVGSVHVSSWPVHNEAYLVTDELTIVVQVNGKLRANIMVPNDATEETIVAAAQADQSVQPYIQDKQIRKTVYVPHKLVNFVV